MTRIGRGKSKRSIINTFNYEHEIIKIIIYDETTKNTEESLGLIL